MCIYVASILTGMGPEESGIPDNSWVPADDNPNVTSPYLPPISGKGKVRPLYYSSAEITFKAVAQLYIDSSVKCSIRCI